jgi:hypothetical protein
MEQARPGAGQSGRPAIKFEDVSGRIDQAEQPA